MTASGLHRRLSERFFALPLLLVSLLLFPASLSAQSSNSNPQSCIATAGTVSVKVYFRQGYSTLQPAFRKTASASTSSSAACRNCSAIPPHAKHNIHRGLRLPGRLLYPQRAACPQTRREHLGISARKYALPLRLASIVGWGMIFLCASGNMKTHF